MACSRTSGIEFLLFVLVRIRYKCNFEAENLRGFMNRLEAYCIALGLQGGTIHQIAEYTGVSVDVLLNKPTNPSNSDHSHGYFSFTTSLLSHNKDVVFPENKGNADFWLGVLDGVLFSERIGILNHIQKTLLT